MVERDAGTLVPCRRILLLRVLPLTLVASIPIVGPWLAMIDPVFIFFNKQRQCAHDLIARTAVVKVAKPTSGPGRQPG